MRPTKISLSKEVRTTVCDFLNDDLAMLTDLMLMTKHAHWNVRGDGFYAMHKLLDDLAEGVEDHIDDIAERITALGGEALGTATNVCDATRLKEYTIGTASISEHVKALIERFAVAANFIREDIDKAEAEGDQVTLDLLAGVAGSMDKYLWFLEAQAS